MSQEMAELEAALATYKSRMAESNRAFWTAKIHALEQDISLTDRRRLDILARYFQEGKWGKTGHGSSITQPSQLLIPRGQPGHVELGIDSDGVSPPADEAAVNTFLEKLADAVNQGPSDQTLEVPEEYRHLLKLTDAISDWDFRGSGIAGLDGVCGGVPSRHDLSDMCYSRDHWEDDGWTVLGGWQTGMGHERTTHLLFGKKDTGSPEEQRLAWRVFAVDGAEDHERRWFSSIASFLLYTCEWLQRLPPGWEHIRPRIPIECGIDTDEESDYLAESDSDAEVQAEDEDDGETDSLDDRPPYQAFDCTHEVFPERPIEYHGVNKTPAESSLEERLMDALKNFGEKQQDSIHQWLKARIRKITESAEIDPSESQQSLERLAASFGCPSWSVLADLYHLAGPRDLLFMAKDIGQLDKGTRPPVSQEDLNDFLARLTVGINQVYDLNDPTYEEMPLPEDYKILLSITDGICDNDLRASGVCGVNGVRGADVSKMAPDETEKLPCGNDMWRKGWDLNTGFLVGRGSEPVHNWLVYYYCARVEVTMDGRQRIFKDEIKDHERGWKWRLFYKEKDRARHSFGWPMVFESIAEWLEFYQCWWDREIMDLLGRRRILRR